MFLFFETSLIQTKVLEGLWGVGGAFNENKTSELYSSKILKWKKENKKPELSNSKIKYLIKFPSYEKLAMTSQFDLTRFYDVITSVF